MINGLICHSFDHNPKSFGEKHTVRMKDDDGDEHQTFDSNHITELHNTG